MGHYIVRDAQSKSYFISGKGHSWGSFDTWGEANDFIKQVEVDNAAFKARQVEARVRIEKQIAEQDADWLAAKRARLESDRLLYEGRLSQGFITVERCMPISWKPCTDHEFEATPQGYLRCKQCAVVARRGTDGSPVPYKCACCGGPTTRTGASCPPCRVRNRPKKGSIVSSG